MYTKNQSKSDVMRHSSVKVKMFINFTLVDDVILVYFDFPYIRMAGIILNDFLINIVDS